VIVVRILKATPSEPAVRRAVVELYFSGVVISWLEKISVDGKVITLGTEPSGGCR
jgi:hypothetical protein